MSDNVYIGVEVKSNTDSLSAKTLRNSLFGLVGDIVVEGTDFLRIAVPKGNTLELSKHVGHTGPYDEGTTIVGHVGIPLIDTKSLGSFDPNSMKYPLYVDEGTGIFGVHESSIFSKRSDYMKLPPDGIHSIFQKEIKGQRGQHFMEKTFEFMKESLKPNVEKFKIDLSSKFKADKLT